MTTGFKLASLAALITAAGPAWAGGACRFDGVDDYVDLGNPDALRLTGC